MRLLAVIPARSGSTGVPDKNIMPLLGRPIFAYTFDRLMEIPYPFDVAISTDNDYYAHRFCQWCRDHLPDTQTAAFIRPPEMRGGHLPSTVAAQHVLPLMEERNGIQYDAVVMAYPCVPVRPRGVFERLLMRLWRPDNPTSVFGICEVDTLNHPRYQIRVDAEGVMTYAGGLIPMTQSERQTKAETIYRFAACGYAFRRETILNNPLTTPEDVHAIFGSRRVAVTFRADECVEIDEPGDIEWAEFLLRRRGY